MSRAYLDTNFLSGLIRQADDGETASQIGASAAKLNWRVIPPS